MKIAIGVCGIGIGHTTRQFCIANALRKKGHEIRIFTSGDAVNFFQNEGFIVYEVFVPFIKYNKGSLDFISLIRNNYKTFIKGTIKNLIVYKNLIKEKFDIDIVITDYDPFVAKLAKKFKCKLYTFDQQSKFLFMKEKLINNFTNIEEKKRLNLFFPKVEHRYITTFYKLNDEFNISDNVTICLPVIKVSIQNNRNEIKENIIVIYLSSYGDNGITCDFDRFLLDLKNIKDVDFYIFGDYKQDSKVKNIIFKQKNNEEFSKILGKAKGVITTAGHTLISEALYLSCPIYTIPLNTFDQQYCASFIEENKLGINRDKLQIQYVLKFLKDIEIYKKNIIESNMIFKNPLNIDYIVDDIIKKALQNEINN